MRYENPLHLAEEIAALDLLLDQRIAIGISRGYALNPTPLAYTAACGGVRVLAKRHNGRPNRA